MLRLLLVEDDEGSRDGLSRHLRRKGFEVLVAADGRQGIEAAPGRGPGPGPDGHEPPRYS